MRSIAHASRAPQKKRAADSNMQARAMAQPVLSSPGKSACACGGGCPRCNKKSPVQAKLRVSQPGDALEREADQVADQIMRVPSVDSPADAKPNQNTGLRVSRYTQAPAASSSVDVPPVVHDVLQSPGQSMHAQTRGYFEPRFGVDFSDVRVHTGGKAAESARAIGAVAYTAGRNVVFGENQYAPASTAGRRLLAHELTHVVQQRGSPQGIQRQTEGLPASSLIPSLSEAPHGNQQCLPEHSCSVSAATPVSGTPLSAADVTSRRQQVQLAIDRSRATYPIAAGNLQHWLDRTGTTRILPGSIFQASDSGVPGFLQSGQLMQEAHLDMFHDGIQRRLSASDPESLLPVGTLRVLRYCNSMRAMPSDGATAADLSIALGGFTVKSWVTLSARQVSTSIPLITQYQVTVQSWRVQVCDRYDWIANAIAQMPMPVPDSELADMPFPDEAVQIRSIPGTGHSTVQLRDDWFRQLETSGGGRQYALYSEIFDAPATLRAMLEAYTFNVL